MARNNSDPDSIPADTLAADPAPIVEAAPAPAPAVADAVTIEVVEGVTIERGTYGGQDRYVPAPE